MAQQSLVSCVLSWLFLLGGVVALAVVLYRDELRSWWREVTR